MATSVVQDDGVCAFVDAPDAAPAECIHTKPGVQRPDPASPGGSRLAAKQARSSLLNSLQTTQEGSETSPPASGVVLTQPAVDRADQYLRQLEVLLEREPKLRASPTYIDEVQAPHSGMTPRWRKSLVEWMMEFMESYRFSADVCALAVSYMDRFMSKVAVDKDCMQLLVIVCCFTASKILARKHIRLAHLLRLFPDYTSEHFRGTEVHITFALGWDMNSTTAHTFLQWLSPLVPAQHRAELIARAEVMADVCLAEYPILRFPASAVAIACLLAAYDSLPHLDATAFVAALKACPVQGLPLETANTIVEPTLRTFLRTFPDAAAALEAAAAPKPKAAATTPAQQQQQHKAPRNDVPSPTTVSADVGAGATGAVIETQAVVAPSATPSSSQQSTASVTVAVSPSATRDRVCSDDWDMDEEDEQ